MRYYQIALVLWLFVRKSVTFQKVNQRDKLNFVKYVVSCLYYIRTDLTSYVLFQLSGGLTTPYPGFATPASSGDLDLNKIGEARKSLVGVKLDQVCIFFPFGWLFCCSCFGFLYCNKGRSTWRFLM